jgi:DNA-binding NarL/FixJ family response regulator
VHPTGAIVAECIRVLIAEDQFLVRTALRSLLREQTWIKVVGEAADGEETIILAQRLQPDVLLLDLMMPGKTGVEVLHELHRLDMAVRVVVLTAHDDDDVMMAAFSAGADGFLLKTAPPEELFALIRSVHNNQTVVNPAIANKFVRKMQHTMRVSSLMGKLTSREREVLLLVAYGHNDRDIAHKFGVSTRTIRNHISQVESKLKLRSRIEIALFALRNGLVHLKDIQLKRSFRSSRTPDRAQERLLNR